MRRTNVIRLLLIVFFALKIVAGQSADGTISGIVFDPDGKAIPHAELLIVNDATGISYPGATKTVRASTRFPTSRLVHVEFRYRSTGSRR